MQYLTNLLLLLICFVSHSNEAEEACEPLQTKCKNNQCIDSELFCDGKEDCFDGSDETTEACAHNVCAQYLFRCSYGACIARDLVCNNLNDCSDGSDEAVANCTHFELSTDCNTKKKVRCNSSECILQENLCDGKADCKDASDESLSVCSSMQCSSYTFRCAYGACISKQLLCNGVADCADASDEQAHLCSHKKCLRFTFRCAYGACISKYSVCDGLADCIDGSDEQLSECSNEMCASYEFKCGYGACIPKEKECNGYRDCFDNSDEINCTSIIFQTECLIPTLKHGKVLDYNTKFTFEPDTYVRQGTVITYQCDKTYHPLPNFKTNLCAKGWKEGHPRCIKMCEPLTKHISTRAYCKDLLGLTVSCHDYVPTRTTAKIVCADSYVKINSKGNDDLRCHETSEWDYTPFKCKQSCGVIDTSVPLIYNGTKTDVQKVPWNVAIYESKEGKYNFICGGTLVYPKIVISAAHCFWQASNETLRDPSHYKIKVGNSYRDYYASNETRTTQKSLISSIDYPIHYADGHYDYTSDIAVLTLVSDIEYKPHIRPACIHWTTEDDKTVKSNATGLTSGFGLAKDGSPDELQSAKFSSLDRDTCQNYLRIADRNLRVARDKFCVIASKGQMLCQGDSGTGFLVTEDVDNARLHTLWGVVSNAIPINNTDRTCNEHWVASFTNIQEHRAFVENIIKKLGYV